MTDELDKLLASLTSEDKGRRDGGDLMDLYSADKGELRSAIEAQMTTAVKFVDVPLPTDKGRRTVSGGVEKLESITRMDATASRFSAQMVDRRIQTPKAIAAFKEADGLMPDQALASVVNLDSMGFVDAMLWEKKYRRAAQNGEYYNVTAKSSDTDECWRRTMLCSIRAFSIEPKDLLLVHILDDYHGRGLTAKFPEETARLLEVGVKMNEDPTGKVQLKFFEKYYRFQLERGKLDEALEFFLENIDIFLNSRLTDSTVFNDLLKKHPNGEIIRMELSRRSFKTKGRQISDGAMISTHLVTCELATNGGDYKAVGKFLGDKRICTAYGFDAEGVRRNTEALIPEYYANAKSMKDDPATVRSYTLKTIHRVIEHTATRDNIDAAIGAIIEAYESETISYDDYRDCVVRFLNTFANPETCEPSMIVEALVKFGNAEKSGHLKFPIDLSNIGLARLLEAYYVQGKHSDVIRVARKFSDLKVKDRMLRGTAYYYMKSCLETAGDNPAVIAEGITAISTRLQQFAGSKWEEEIWLDYLLPHYNDCADVIHSHSGGNGEAISILDQITKKNPANINARVALIGFTARNRKFIGTLPRLCHALVSNPSGKSIDVSRSVLLEAADALNGSGMRAEAIEVIRMAAQVDESEESALRLCRFLLEPSKNLNESCYDEAVKWMKKHSGLRDKLATQLQIARERLKIVEYTEIEQGEYLDRLLKSDRAVEGIGGEDGVRIGFLAGALREASSFYREMLGADFNWENLEKGRDLAASFDVFGFEKVMFGKGKEGAVAVRLELKPGKAGSLEREYISLEFDRDLRLGFVDIRCAPEQESHARIFVHLLEAACLEEMTERVSKEYIGVASEALSPSNSKLLSLREKVDEYFGLDRDDAFKIEGTGMSGIIEKNRKVLGRIMEGFPGMQKSPNFPGKDEVQGLIARYIELIGTCRDIERPTGSDGHYRAIVNDSNPIFRYTKYLKIFGDEAAQNELASMQVDKNDLSTLWATTEGKNNFSGYYELVCFFPDIEEISISVFLDNNGIAHVPGIDKNNPLYNHIWMLTLESLALKVVPELKPYFKAIRGKSGESRDPHLKTLSLHPVEEMSALTIKKRICCNHLIITGTCDQSGDHTPKRRLAELDDITSAFNIVELTEKDVTTWPMFMKVGKRYLRVRDLFQRKDDKTYINPAKLREIFEDVEVEGDEMLAIETISQDIRDRLMEALRIQILNGRAYRMPVELKIAEHEITIGVDGKEYFLVPAGNKRGKTIEKDGELYRLVEVPPHEKITIAGTVYHAVPWQMSDNQREIYEQTSTITIDFEKIPVVYFVLYDKKSGEVLAKSCPGQVESGLEGNHGSIEARRSIAAHESGDFACFIDEKIKAALNERKDELAEAMFIVNTNMGYRQGVFPKLWKYLTAGRDVHDAAVRLLLDTMRQKLDSAGYREFAQRIIKERFLKKCKSDNKKISSKEKSRRGKPKSRAQQVKPSSAQRLRQTEKAAEETRIYRLTYGPNSSEYAGLAGTDLYIVEKNHPLYNTYMNTFDLKAGEVIVLVSELYGRPSKCLRSLLVPKPVT